MDHDLTARVRDALRTRLELAGEAGVRQLPRVAAAAPATVDAAARPAPRPDEVHQSATGVPSGATRPESTQSETTPPATTETHVMEIATPPEVLAADSLEVLQPLVAACTRCDELARTRTQTVFGVGNPNARLCFLGEAPGAEEDRTGVPFVGRAGKLLTDIIEKGMRLTRDDVYILNILKCRPPGNRNPTPQESCNCRPFLHRQFELIQPEFICCLGAVAAQNLLETTTTIGNLRGVLHEWRGMRVVCTYHPAYLLRNPSKKEKTWEDIQLLMREMGI